MLILDRVAVDVRACAFAFQAGQLLERLLLDRSIELARQSGSSTATAEHVESCLDHALFDQLLKRVRENSHGGNAGESRVDGGRSVEAA